MDIKKVKKYVDGKWVSRKPIKPGLYHTQTKTGIIGPDIIAYYDNSGNIKLSRKWDELFWSEPMYT